MWVLDCFGFCYTDVVDEEERITIMKIAEKVTRN